MLSLFCCFQSYDRERTLIPILLLIVVYQLTTTMSSHDAPNVGFLLLCCLVAGVVLISLGSTTSPHVTGRYVCGSELPTASEQSNPSFPTCIQLHFNVKKSWWWDNRSPRPQRPLCMLSGSSSAYGPPVYCYENTRRTTPAAAFLYWSYMYEDEPSHHPTSQDPSLEPSAAPSFEPRRTSQETSVAPSSEPRDYGGQWNIYKHLAYYIDLIQLV